VSQLPTLTGRMYAKLWARVSEKALIRRSHHESKSRELCLDAYHGVPELILYSDTAM